MLGQLTADNSDVRDLNPKRVPRPGRRSAGGDVPRLLHGDNDVAGSSLKERGRSSPLCQTACDGFSPFPAWVRTYAGEGSVSRLDRRSTRVSGLSLTPTPIGAESSRRERGFVVVGGRVLQRPKWTLRRAGVRLPVILRHRHGWHGVIRPQSGVVNQVRTTAPRTWGSDTARPRFLTAPARSHRSGQATDVPVA